ncbi:putative acyl-activating enzyme 1, peroxisomal [Trifolium repens]|nr:putative acyl-activating enzyme 1, peroxisomal [Trifolium repens]
MEGSMQCNANYVPLTPISFLERSAIVYGDKLSMVFNNVTYTWSQTHQRCIKLASSISQLGVSQHDVVAVLAYNTPATYELHFAVPMSGAIICALNTHSDSSMVSLLLNHCDAKILFVDHQLLDVAKEALEIMSKSTTNLPTLVLILETDVQKNTCISPETLIYENLIAEGKLDFEVKKPKDECDTISISYTSGTTATPKGAIHSHRGAYLNSLSTVIINEMKSSSVYLWCVPMFHCNGWCVPWSMAAQGGTNICLRNVSAKVIFENVFKHNVTHMGGAPTILNMIINAPLEFRKPVPWKVQVMTGGAPPPPAVFAKMEELGFYVTHAYGMTETYGPASICTWKPEWSSLPQDAQAKLKARQGVLHIGMAGLDIKDPVTMKSVPADAKTIGEIMFRGNNVMKGYLNDLKGTEDAFKDGWYKTGDLGVKHPDGYIEVKDRSKDIIIAGEENYISTIELEGVIYNHPAVFEVAVVGRPDEYWGETPCAFVKLKEGYNATEKEIIQLCQKSLPHVMAPQTVVFGDLPKTSTGKTQKYVLREKTKAMGKLI